MMPFSVETDGNAPRGITFSRNFACFPSIGDTNAPSDVIPYGKGVEVSQNVCKAVLSGNHPIGSHFQHGFSNTGRAGEPSFFDETRR